jgi:hypothetical protein
MAARTLCLLPGGAGGMPRYIAIDAEDGRRIA